MITFIKLPIPTDERIPDGYSLVVAYAKGDEVVVPIENLDDNDPHSCDWEGCGSLDHVVRFRVSEKYAEVKP